MFETVKKRFDEIIELTNETNLDDLIYYFKEDSSSIRFNDFEKETIFFEK